jgi:hypothetical protein
VRFLRSGQKWMKLPEQNDSKWSLTKNLV